MSASLVVFDDERFGRVRSVVVDGEPWFVAADVCSSLGLGRHQDSTRYLDDDELGVCSVDTPGGLQSMTTVSEAGLFSLILRSRRPEAKAFKRWVTHEVLPAIRRQGSYSLEVPTTFAGALQLAANQALRIEQQHAELVRARPMLELAEDLISADGSYSLREAAQILDSAPNISTGQTRLSRALVSLGWVDRGRGMPYQATLQAGRMVVRTYPFTHPTEGRKMTTQLRITPKGLAELHERLPLLDLARRPDRSGPT